MKKEIRKCKDDLQSLDKSLDEARAKLKNAIAEKLIPSLWFHVSSSTKEKVHATKVKHKRKLENLSALQDTPLLNTKGFLTVLDDIEVPETVKACLRYGPRHPILTQFRDEHFLARLDNLLTDCQKHDVPVDVTNRLNALALGYSNHCNGQKPPRAVEKTAKWLKTNGILAVPYDKGKPEIHTRKTW